MWYCKNRIKLRLIDTEEGEDDGVDENGYGIPQISYPSAVLIPKELYSQPLVNKNPFPPLTPSPPLLQLMQC